MAEMYAERGLNATFYIPIRNREGRSVMNSEDIRAIDKCGFEIGSHTLDHCYLDKLEFEIARQQVVQGKNALENILSHDVTGFCYPGGVSTINSKKIMLDAGITHARGIENMRTDLNFSQYEIPTTLQFYPHNWDVLIRNMLKYPNLPKQKFKFVLNNLKKGNSLKSISRIFESMIDVDIVFHLWGHSWEIESLDAWDDLRYILDIASINSVKTLNVGELSRVKA
jgi:hypothetical protein